MDTAITGKRGSNGLLWMEFHSCTDNDGCVHAFGTFDGTVEPMLEQPKTDEEVISIAAGTAHIMALTASGRVYTWGCNEHYQLGRMTSSRQNAGTSVPTALRLKNIVYIASGHYHSFAV